MIKLIFTFEREVIIFEINNKKIRYYDRKWQNGINFIPRDNDFVKLVLFSRNRINHNIVEWINDANAGSNLKEWEDCKDDEEVAVIVKRDAKIKGCVLQKEIRDADIIAAEQARPIANEPGHYADDLLEAERIANGSN